MKGTELIIKFRANLAFLTEEVALDFNQVRISDNPVKFNAPAFWTVCVIDYNEYTKRLFVQVVDYQVGEIDFPDYQIQLADILLEIEKVDFKSIDTTGLIKTLSSTQPIKILPPKSETVYRKESTRQSEKSIKNDPTIETYIIPFSISIKDVKFLNGCVAFEKKIQELRKLIRFQIRNDNIIEQYDAVKNYFASVLKTKKIQVFPAITIVEGEISSISATSPEIDKINQSLIEEVKDEFISIVRSKEQSSEKQLFTMDEFFETFIGEEAKGQQFFKDENDFFESLLRKFESKHYKQLRFLSSRHRQDLQKLQFVQRPFSFVFLIGGVEKLYFVWETLDTEEATYMWTYPNDSSRLNDFLAQTNKTINLILKEKKNEYINRKEKNFHRFLHDYRDIQNGFKKWKDSVEELVK